jgi:hypothetical protein
MQNNSVNGNEPWWRFGHVWLVISGPVLVIFACVVTAYFIMTSPNELVTDANYEQIMAQKKALGDKLQVGGDAPALQARNHAATGVVPLPK